MTTTADPAGVPGLPESRLSTADLAALPARNAEAPWTCRARAVTWIQRATAPEFGWLGSPAPLAMVSFVQYLDTPVGPYHEVLAAAVLKPRRGLGLLPVVQVPFIAVDSLPSVLGGRANWALPKTMASFGGDLPAARAQATGDGWSIAIRPSHDRPGRSFETVAAGTATVPARRSLALPMVLRFRSAGPLGRATTTLRASGRPILIRSRIAGETLSGWLGSGRHLAFTLTGQMRIDPPEPW